MSEGVVKRAWAAQIWWSTYVKDACVATCVAKAVSEGLGVVLVPVKCRYVARVRVVAWVFGQGSSFSSINGNRDSDRDDLGSY